MTWVFILLMALVVFAGAVVFLRMPRVVWTVFALSLVLGLSGYALQGAPDQPGGPRAQAVADDVEGFAFIEARRAFFGPDQQPSRYVIIADGFARRGQHADAAEILQGAIVEDPGDAEAWMALANALVEHADGTVTPAALFAYRRAEEAAPGNYASTYYLGLAMLRAGNLRDAVSVWKPLLVSAPKDAPWRLGLAAQLMRLEQLIAQSEATGGAATE